MARTALRAGYEVVVYARVRSSLADIEEREGYQVRRVPSRASLALPGMGWISRHLIRSRRHGPTAGATGPGVRSPVVEHATLPDDVTADATTAAATTSAAAMRPPPSSAHRLPLLRDVATTPLAAIGRLVLMFPLRPIAWSRQLDSIIEPADVYHGMWAGSLPALVRHSRRLGGRTIYDSRDVYMESRGFASAPTPIRWVLSHLERRWARRVDRVLTVNEGYAELIAEGLGVRRPPVVRNCPERWVPPEPRPNLIREALGLSPETAIVLYQGQLITDRGIEQTLDAILEVDDAVLVLLGFGGLRAMLEARSRVAPYAGKVFLLPAVPPDHLLRWTASADVSVMAIAPTTINHRYSTPQKLFESFAAGVPVVASDLPGMAEVVRDADVGALCDPLSPSSIAGAIRALISGSPAVREARRERVLALAHERYTWEAQEETLLRLYAGLLEPRSERS
jgi:glycosyltransferase involved in cell wall biosynthesis